MPEPVKTALVTGASSGIGEAFARHLAADGWQLILVARRLERLEQISQNIANQGLHAPRLIAADLGKEADLSSIEQIIRDSSPLDLLVNNAGFGMSGYFTKIDIEAHMQMIQLHVTASVRLAYAALPAMIARRQGAIINVSSVVAFVPWGNVTYNATKAYLVTFSEALSAELKNRGVRVQALCPGYTTTEFFSSPHLSRERAFPLPGWLWYSPEYVVKESLKALARNKIICVPGFPYRVIAGLGRNSFTSPVLRSAVIRFKK
jgi:hypothetical protein